MIWGPAPVVDTIGFICLWATRDLLRIHDPYFWNVGVSQSTRDNLETVRTKKSMGIGVHARARNPKTLIAHWSPSAENIAGLNKGKAAPQQDLRTMVAAMELAKYSGICATPAPNGTPARIGTIQWMEGEVVLVGIYHVSRVGKREVLGVLTTQM
ncbi:hypothetical protein DXG01_000444 [Tephrocybe rancida]|nr:hypothetical protein DXG01_000444 [Tephrocybe rancida]